MGDILHDLERELISADRIAARIKAMAAEIERDFTGGDKPVIMVGVLRGSVIFFADLIRAVGLPVETDFIAISSYGASSETSGEVKLVKDVSTPLAGRDVIIVEDIVDTGLTLAFLKRLFDSRSPARLKVCALLDKPSRRKTKIAADYTGFEIEDKFVVGYGLDYAQRYRNLGAVYELKESVYRK